MLSDRSILIPDGQVKSRITPDQMPLNAPLQNDAAKRRKILQLAASQCQVRELTGHNDGPMVESYLHYTGNKKGDPWCASFVSWVYGQAGLPAPKTAWSPSLFTGNHQVTAPLTADIFGIYFPGIKRIGHCGLVRKCTGSWIYTIEGNTNLAGSREGDGVYKKIRHIRSIRLFANWIRKPKKGGPS